MTRTRGLAILSRLLANYPAWGVLTASLLTAFLFGAGSSGAARRSPSLTFNKDIAPIIHKNCAVCHHPGGSAPFTLLTFSDVRKRATQIVTVTQSRYMPPWLPEPGYGEFAGERRLKDEQVEMIREWVEQGAAEGATSELPPVPQFPEGWELGEPDLIVEIPQPYRLRAAGSDVFRNFVLPIPIENTRYVRALEMHPGNKTIVHHANILLDRTGSSRRLDAQDPEVGFGGMEIRIESEQFEPQTHFLFWKPGTVPAPEPEGMAWRLDPGTDLILNMHLQPSGKPELIRPVVGLYFTDQVPTQFPMLIQLEHDGALDIPPGAKSFVVTDEFRLPLDVNVLAIYPHAHYLGKDIQGYATLPDGSRKWLIWIKNWDLNWQAVFQYSTPIFLPKGTTIHMRWTYDNSTENIRNPSRPPARVRTGNRSADEMSHLWIQVLPRHREDLKILELALMRRRLEKYPDDFEGHFNLGAILQSQGQLEEAIRHLRAALSVSPHNPTVHNNLGAALQSLAKLDEAEQHFRRALTARPDYPDAHYNLGVLLLTREKAEEAADHFRAVLQARPEDEGARNHLGRALAAQGRLEEASQQFERALKEKPDFAEAQYNLARVLAQRGELARAAREFEKAVQLDPTSADMRNDLGTVLALQGKFVEAANEFEAALRLNPHHSHAQENLKRALARLAKRP